MMRGGRHVSIDLAFHAHLQQHKEENISRFLALPEVISARKRKRQQPFLDFTRSKILTSTTYTQGCEDEASKNWIFGVKIEFFNEYLNNM